MSRQKAVDTIAKTGAVLVASMYILDMPMAFAQELAVGLEEVIVTARKREESLLTVPVAVSAIGGEALERSFAQNLQDLEGVAPNVIIDTFNVFRNSASIAIRGISFQEIEKSFDPAVGVVVDGVFLGTNAQAMIDNFDLERVEILRGPQGTLFGKNTIGGTVNVVRTRPDYELGGKSSYSFGNEKRHELKAAFNMPLVAEQLAMRVAASYRNSDGYHTNIVDGENWGGDDVFSVRAAVLYQPNEEWELYFNLDATRDRSETSAQRNVSNPFQLIALPGLLGLNPTYPGYPASTGSLEEFSSNIDPEVEFDIYGATAEVNYSQNDYVVTSITNYRWVEERVPVDFDGENSAIFDSVRSADHEQFSQEIRIASNWSEKYDLVAGLYFFWQEYDADQTIDVFSDWIPCGVLPGAFAAFGCTQRGLNSQTTNSFAAFAQANYNITDRLRLTVGGRYTYEEKEFSITPLTYPLGASGVVDLEEDWSEFTPRVGLDYQLNDSMFFYASYATGFKSGGFNGRAATLTSAGPYNPEQVDAFEIGLKSEWFDNRLRLSMAAFHNSYDDMHVEIIRNSPAGSGQETVVENAASATTYGFELELLAQPTPQLRLTASVGLLEAEYDNFVGDLTGDGTVTDNSALQLRRAPESVFSLGLNYDIPIADRGKININALYTWQDDMETTTQNLSFGSREATGLLNANIGYETQDGKWLFSLWGRNITDEQFIIDGVSAGILLAIATPSIPRQYGVQVDFRF